MCSVDDFRVMSNYSEALEKFIEPNIMRFERLVRVLNHANACHDTGPLFLR